VIKRKRREEKKYGKKIRKTQPFFSPKGTDTRCVCFSTLGFGEDVEERK
jgi:hypothetical protein